MALDPASQQRYRVLQKLKAAAKMGAMAPGPVAIPNGNAGASQQGTRGKPSDQRFRSFAERFMIARAHLFRVEPEGLAEDTWSCILDAKRAYNMIARTGQNIEPEDGVF